MAILVWLGVYAAVVATGQRFNTAYLNFGWQLIPWDILSSDPIRSTWYLHIQPPMWNLLLGSSAWVSPVSDALTLQIVMAGFGILAAGSAAELARTLGFNRRGAVVVASVACLNPEVLKGAFEPTYELAIGSLLLVTLLLISRLGEVDTRGPRRVLLALACVATAVSMTRSLYHPVWTVAILVIALVATRTRISWRTTAVVFAVPLVVMGSWMIKNDVVFGRATMSSWFGMNLQRAVIPVLDLDDLEAMHADGEVSDIAMIGPFGKYALYEGAVEPCVAKHSHRAVSEPTRTTDEWSPNFNYECYLPIFDRAGRDAWAVARRHPGVWLEGRLWSLRSTDAVATTPAQSSSIVMRSLDRVFSWARLDYSGVLSTRGWGTPIYGQLTAPVDFGLVLIPVYGIVVLAGLSSFVRAIRRRNLTSAGASVLAASVTVVFTVGVGAIAELGEQARFRTMTDPLTVVVAAVVLKNLWSRGKRRRSERTPSIQLS